MNYKKMNLSEFKKMSDSEMKSIMAGSGEALDQSFFNESGFTLPTVTVVGIRHTYTGNDIALFFSQNYAGMYSGAYLPIPANNSGSFSSNFSSNLLTACGLTLSLNETVYSVISASLGFKISELNAIGEGFGYANLIYSVYGLYQHGLDNSGNFNVDNWSNDDWIEAGFDITLLAAAGVFGAGNIGIQLFGLAETLYNSGKMMYETTHK